MDLKGLMQTAGRSWLANNASPRTTKLYDRRGDMVIQDAVGRIRIE